MHEISRSPRSCLLSLAYPRVSYLCMGSSVYLKLRNGRVVPLLSGAEKRAALSMKDHLDSWVTDGQTLSVTNAHGRVEDITPRSVEAIEIVEEP